MPDGSKRPDLEQAAKKQKIDSKAYNELVANASMVDIRLTESTFSVKPEYYENKDDDLLKYHATRGVSDVSFGEPSSFFHATVAFEVAVKLGKKKVLSSKAEYLVVFCSAADVDKSVVGPYVNKVAVHSAYPYFRQLVASQSWASETDLPLLPIIKQKPVKSPD